MRRTISFTSGLAMSVTALSACVQAPPAHSPSPTPRITADSAPLQDLLDAGFDLEQVSGDFLFLKSGPALYRCLVIPREQPTVCTRLS